MKRYLLLATMLTSLAGCGGTNDEQITTVHVSHYREQTFIAPGGYVLWPIGTDDAGNSQPVPHFDHHWGHQYVIRIGKTPVDHPAADAPNYNLRLVSIDSDVVVPATTEFVLTAYPFTTPLFSVTGAGGTLMDGTPFVCSDEQTCADLSAAPTALTSPNALAITFGYSAGTQLPLVVKSFQTKSTGS